MLNIYMYPSPTNDWSQKLMVIMAMRWIAIIISATILRRRRIVVKYEEEILVEEEEEEE